MAHLRSLQSAAEVHIFWDKRLFWPRIVSFSCATCFLVGIVYVGIIFWTGKVLLLVLLSTNPQTQTMIMNKLVTHKSQWLYIGLPFHHRVKRQYPSDTTCNIQCWPEQARNYYTHVSKQIGTIQHVRHMTTNSMFTSLWRPLYVYNLLPFHLVAWVYLTYPWLTLLHPTSNVPLWAQRLMSLRICLNINIHQLCIHMRLKWEISFVFILIL